MQNYSRDLKAGRQDYTLTQNGKVIQSAIYSNRFQGKDSVGSSAVVQGDRKRPNNWSYGVHRSTAPSGIVVYRSGPYVTTRSGHVAGTTSYNSPMILPSTVPNHIYNSCLDRFNEKVRGTIDISVDLAQAGSVARMFKAADKVVSLARALKGSPSEIGSLWLELQYGWKPLLSTIYDTVDRLMDHTIATHRTVKARFSDSVPNQIVTEPIEEVGSSVSGLATRKGRFTCEIGAYLRTDVSDLAAYTSLNPVSIAWELVPYSFVVDWFIDIGGYIRGLETAYLYRNAFVSGYRSDGVFFDGIWNAFRNDSLYTYAVQSTLRQRSLTRTVLTSYPVPRLPSFKAELGSGRLLNAAALLSQFLRR